MADVVGIDVVLMGEEDEKEAGGQLWLTIFYDGRVTMGHTFPPNTAIKLTRNAISRLKLILSFLVDNELNSGTVSDSIDRVTEAMKLEGNGGG